MKQKNTKEKTKTKKSMGIPFQAYTTKRRIRSFETH